MNLMTAETAGVDVVIVFDLHRVSTDAVHRYIYRYTLAVHGARPPLVGRVGFNTLFDGGVGKLVTGEFVTLVAIAIDALVFLNIP